GSEAVDRRQGGDARETGAHIGVCLHCLNSRQVTPRRVDHHSAVVFSDQEAGRDPAIEPGNDIVSVLTQELNELRLISGSTVKRLMSVVTSFVTSIVAFMGSP